MRHLARALLLSLLAVPFSLAQTTGTITGRATDDNGGPLPGASIEARSDALQGTKTAVTQADGLFRLTLLPPGTYSVTATLQGFARVQKVVVVLLDRSATVDFRLSPSATAEVTVTAGAPTIDTTSTTLGNNVTQRSIQSLPTARNYASVVQTVAGTSTDNANSDQTALTVYGSSGAENGYLIDGINTTNVEYGLQGKELNFEFIQEIDVKTGGYEAEHGRATGGIVNVITRSGGNEYHGDAFGYYTDNSLQASNKNIGATLQGATVGFRREDFGADLGGPILKDRLWFFGAYDWVQNTVDNQLTSGPFEGSIIPTKSTRNLGSAKLTWTVASGHSVVASYIQDPRTDTGAINDANHTLNGDLLTFLGEQQFGGRDYALRYDGILTSQVSLSFQGARHDEQNSVGPSTTAGDTIEYIDTRADNFQTGGFGLVQQKSFVRYFAGGSATFYAGNHEIKTGLEWEQETADVVKRMSGGQQVTIFDNPLNAAQPIYQHFYWTIPTATVNPFNAPVSQLNANPKHKILSLTLRTAGPFCRNLTAQRRRPLGPAEDHRRVRRDPDRPQEGFRAARRDHLDSGRRPQNEGLRLVRPLLRADPDGSRDSVVLLRAAAAHHQLQPDFRHPRPSGGRAPRHPRAASSAGSPSRRTRTSATSTSASSSSAASARSHRTWSWAPSTSTATTARSSRTFCAPTTARTASATRGRASCSRSSRSTTPRLSRRPSPSASSTGSSSTPRSASPTTGR